MKIKTGLFIVFSMFLFAACSQFETVYKNKNLLKNNVKVNVAGDMSQQASSYLASLLGTEVSDAKYTLFFSSTKTKKKLVISTSSVATKYRTTISSTYGLYDNILKWEVYNSESVTSNDFDSRSEGYSFGSDAAEKNNELDNLKNNINIFLSEIDRYNDGLVCINEN